MKLKQQLLAAALATVIVGCATQNTPEGGPKDEVPPQLVESTPKDQQLNVDTRTVTLTFDEEIQPNSINKELLITPNINTRYTATAKRNVLTLEFDEPLEDSITYTFNFREGITDITEKNKAQQIVLSFSTGSYIDSSRVSGQVVQLLKQTPEAGAVVALYQAEDTLSVRKNRPYYLTNTDAQGNFTLRNIKQGSYRMYALEDKNNNTYYDNEEERIAYLPEPISITPATDTVLLQTTRIDTRKPILLAREKYTDRFTANYTEGIRAATATSVTGQDTLLTKISADGKAVDLFKTPEFGGGKAILAAVDSAGNISADTLEIAFEGKRAQKIKGAQLKVINKNTAGAYRVGQEVVVELETSVHITGKTPLALMTDSIVVQQLTFPEQISLDRTKTEMRFKLPNINNNLRQVNLVLDTTAIEALTGPTTLNFPMLQLGIAEARGTGSLSGRITTPYTSFTIQLLNGEYRVVEEIRNSKTFRFRNVEPGTYRLRVLVDADNSGEWNAADPEFKKLPEPVYLYPETIDVRANWEIENLELNIE